MWAGMSSGPSRVSLLVIGRVFGNGLIEVSFHIAAHVGVGVFIDGQRRRGVLDEEVKQADFDLAYFRQIVERFARDQDETRAAWP